MASLKFKNPESSTLKISVPGQEDVHLNLPAGTTLSVADAHHDAKGVTIDAPSTLMIKGDPINPHTATLMIKGDPINPVG